MFMPGKSSFLLFPVRLLGRRRSRRRATVLAGAVVAALAGVPVQAQPNPAQTTTGPDYGQVSDFLNGHRSLLKVQDLAIFVSSGTTALYTNYVQTENSQQTQAAGVTQFSFGGGWDGLEELGSFSALMFNPGYETAIATSRSNGILTLLLASGHDANKWNVYYPAN